MTNLRCSLLVSLLLLAPQVAVGADPRLNAIEPPGAQRATEVEVSFRGGRVGQDPVDLMLYEPGIELLEIESVDRNHAKARLKIDAGCPLGVHAMRVRTTSGISDLHTFHIGTLPEISEAEPNSDFDSPQAIEMDSTINGVIKNEDVDYFVVEAKQGERLAVEIEALRLGRTFFDPYVAILDEERFELARCDDVPVARQDAVCAIEAPQDGRYVIEVRETSYRGSNASSYRLHVGSFPRPLAVFPAGGQPGSSVKFHWLGDPLGEQVQEISLPQDDSATSSLHARDELGIAPTGISVRLVDIPGTEESEPNDKRAQATPMQVPGAADGIIAEEGDQDHFRFEAQKDQVYDINAFARRIRSPLDPVLVVRDSEGKRLSANDDRTRNHPDSYIRFKAPADGEYILQLRDHLRSGGPTYVYRIEVEPIAPRAELALRERRRYIAETISIPQGNRAAVLLQAKRENFGGDLDFEISGLPPGVRAEMLTMPGNRPIVPVLLHADEQAELAGTLASIEARRSEGGPVESHFEQQNWLIRGRNNIDVLSHMTDRAAVAVTKKAPFSIEIVQPQVPVVQSGSLPLKVVAHREEGFDKPIRVYLLYNPPGVSSSRSIQIKEGANEATIPLTTSGNAQINQWPIVVVGRAGVGGRLEVASPLARLQVAKPYLDLSFPQAKAEQGQSLEYALEVEHHQQFAGKAQVELLGLPPGASSTPQEITSDTEQIVFPIELAKDARVGQHKSLFCKVIVTEKEEPVTHSIGKGRLRIDEPLPPDANQTAQK